MPRGLPDYYNPDTLVSQRLANVEEVVTAVQGIANLDNRGRTLYYTHFAEGLGGWTTSKTGDGVLAVASTAEAEIDPACMLIKAGTQSGSGISHASKQFIVHNIKSAGVEFSFIYYPNMPSLLLTFSYNNGTDYVHGRVTIDENAKVIQVWDDTTPTNVFTLPASLPVYGWLTLKLVCDFITPAYVRLLVGLDQYDISEYEIKSTDTLQPGILNAKISATAQGDGVNIAYIGHVAITIDEP